MPKIAKITEQQKQFVREYLKTGNLVQSALASGYSESTARGRASKIFNRPYVQAYKDELLKEKVDNDIADINEAMRFLTNVMRGKEKDAFGLDSSLDSRLVACREIIKRTESKEGKGEGVTIINNIPRPEPKE